jgi:putative acetyltransferase
LRIRAEAPEDAPAIFAIEERAFGKPDEARIVDVVRASEGFVPDLSLVAEEGGVVVGHVLLSYARLGERQVLLLGPIGVLPERQRHGIGSALVEEGLRRAEERGEPMVVLEGDPRFYSRFGFLPAADFGVEPLPPAQAKYVQVRPLSAYDESWRGELEYPRAFA